MNAAIQGRSRYLDGLPAIELWGVSNGRRAALEAMTRETGGAGIINSQSEAHRARRRLKSDWRASKKHFGISFRAYLRSLLTSDQINSRK